LAEVNKEHAVYLVEVEDEDELACQRRLKTVQESPVEICAP
jgi:hypothetical protein